MPRRSKSSTLAPELSRDERAIRVGELRQWLRAVQAEWAGETPPDEVVEAIQANHQELREHEAELGRLEARDQHLRELAGAGSVEPGSDPGIYGRGGDRDTPPYLRADRDRALRVVERVQRDAVMSNRAADSLDRLLREDDPVGAGARYLAAVGDPAYRRAFMKLIRDPMHGHLRMSADEVEAMRRVSAVQAEQAQMDGLAERAMGVSTGSAGQFALPVELDPTILLSSNGALNPVRQVARVEQISTFKWTGVSSDGVTAGYGSEATEASDNSPVLAQPTITPARGFAFVPVSIELTQDWGSIQSELARLFRDGRDVVDATKLLSGSGTNEPQGLLTGLTTTQRVQTATTPTYVVGDPWLLKAQVPARFLNSTTFAASPSIWDATYRFVGGNSTEPLQMPSRDGPMMGRPKIEWSTMQAQTTPYVTGQKVMIGGDFSQFIIVDRIGMDIELIPHLFGTNLRPTGQRGFYALWRTGSVVAVPNAFRYLEVK
jgi:HK97 family phage major capsid protein